MKTYYRNSLLLSALGIVELAVRPAAAQSDITFSKPNVLLLVDSSGSMEYLPASMSTGNSLTQQPACQNPPVLATDPETAKSRWTKVIEVLGGTIQNYKCQLVTRSGSGFDEYKIGAQVPPDFGYPIAYHRPVSGNCVRGPNKYDVSKPFAPVDLSNNFANDSSKSNSFADRAYSGTVTCGGFSQSSDGVITAFEQFVRFGLMTFDTNTDASTGDTSTYAAFAGPATPSAGVRGTWSYYYGPCEATKTGWGDYANRVEGDCARGRPAGCITDPIPMFEVGARNPGAPPWEGRMVAFGDPKASTDPNPCPNDDSPTRAEWIRNILLTTRPFGATPIAGMLDDARTYLTIDQRKDPVFTTSTNPNCNKDFGPYHDPNVTEGCRKNYIVLLTDGEPNLDLRSYTGAVTGSSNGTATSVSCDSTNGKCPYETAYDIAADLYTNHGVQTFVVGFSISSKSGIDCSTAALDDVCAAATTDANLQACCTLDKLADYGSGGHGAGTGQHAYFASSASSLSLALSAIFSKVSTGTTSRTWPVTASGANMSTSNGVAGYRFFTSFTPAPDFGKSNNGQQGALWSGLIERQRYVCQKPDANSPLQAVAQPLDKNVGDEFSYNVNSKATVYSRQFYSVIAKDSSSAVNSVSNIRPNLTTDDGAGFQSGSQPGTQVTGDKLKFPTASGFGGGITATDLANAMQISTSCNTDMPATYPDPARNNASACAARRLNWLIGGDPAADPTGYTRCSSTPCSLVADVFHSTPAVVNRPTDAPRDQTYQAFAGAWGLRPLMLYTSTNDGMLHAFKVASNYSPDALSVTNSHDSNEVWAFIPPAVLPNIDSEWPGSHKFLLDGAPITANVIATRNGSYTDDQSPKYKLERTAGDFATAVATAPTSTAASPDGKCVTPTGATWRTILVQGLNAIQGGYFALDITNPELASYKDNPYREVGSCGPGPRFLWQLTDSSSTNRLFGKQSATPLITTLFFKPTSSDDAREIAVAILPGGFADPRKPLTSVSRGSSGWASGIDSRFAPRANVPLYDSDEAKAARSLTIVRLDTGEIVRTFRRAADWTSSVPSTLTGRVINTQLDSPITGQPVAYPALAGAIADRVFVGDRDGGLWRVNLSSPNPSEWSMSLFFDAYSSKGATDGQPIITQPQLSVDDLGNVTVAFATGDQNTFSTTYTNYVWSLLEAIDWTSNPVRYKSEVKWYYKYVNGEVPVGPLQLFANGLYYATYAPTANSACGLGVSTLWGMHYKDEDPSAAVSDSTGTYQALSRGGVAWLPSSSGNVQKLIQPTGTTIFGVSIAPLPSCVDNMTTTDSFFGSATHTTLPNITPATYQLVMQTGSTTKNSTPGTTNVTTINLTKPANGPRIASWAAIME